MDSYLFHLQNLGPSMESQYTLQSYKWGVICWGSPQPTKGGCKCSFYSFQNSEDLENSINPIPSMYGMFTYMCFFMVNVGRIDKYTRTIYEWYIPFVNGMGMKLHQGESRWQLPNVLISIFQACKKTYTPEN